MIFAPNKFLENLRRFIILGTNAIFCLLTLHMQKNVWWEQYVCFPLVLVRNKHFSMFFVLDFGFFTKNRHYETTHLPQKISMPRQKCTSSMCLIIIVWKVMLFSKYVLLLSYSILLSHLYIILFLLECDASMVCDTEDIP